VERRRDGSRRLIAHPDPSVLPAGDTQTNSITELRDRPAAEFVKLVLADEKLMARIRAGNSILFMAAGQEYFGSARKLTRPGLPDWVIAVIIPVNDVMGGVYANDRRAFWIGLTCLVAVTVLAVRLARRVARPLRQLTREAHAIGRLELSAKTDAPSRIKEVAQLASSMSDMKSSLRSFQKFVPIDVVREIVITATEARLGGKPALLTMFFSDIADFTAIAESMKPEEVVAHVGEYLGEMSEVILAGQGTVDKFIGDGIMAFWGAPKDNASHATDACRTALQCQQRLAELRIRWRIAGKPELRARIGLHTGPVIVGNIGSEKRLNYTAIGDSVNLTSRIEGLNKFYGTEILISFNLPHCRREQHRRPTGGQRSRQGPP
jgi:adenylate cyclase